MRKTPLPLLRELRSGVVVWRCCYCESLVLVGEACQSSDEAKQCPPRAVVVEGRADAA